MTAADQYRLSGYEKKLRVAKLRFAKAPDSGWKYTVRRCEEMIALIKEAYPNE